MKKPKLCIKERGDNDQAVVLIPGMWTEDDGCDERWVRSLRDSGFEGTIYDYVWDSSNELGALQRIVAAVPTGTVAGGLLMGAMPVGLAALRYYWTTLKSRAKKAGADFLADALEKGVAESHVTLLGHSLGARVAYYGVMAGAKIDRFVMAGGAIRRDSSKDWAQAADRVAGGIFNVRNSQDDVLSWLFRVAELRQNPVGLKPIKAEHSRINDLDATEIMKAMGRTGWKNSHTHYFRVLPETRLFR